MSAATSSADPISRLRLAQIPGDGFFELARDGDEVVCVGFDPVVQRVVELHIANTAGEGVLDSEVYARLSRAATQLRHQNLAAVYDAGEDEAPYYVSQFIDGEPIDLYLARCGELPQELLIRILRGAARGLVACLDQPAVLAGLDLAKSRVILGGSTIGGFSLVLTGYHFGMPQAEELSVDLIERHYIRALAKLAVWATAGQFERHTDLDPARLQAACSPKLLRLLEGLDGESPVATLADAASLIDEAFPGMAGSGLERFPVQLLPALPLEPLMITRAKLEQAMAPGARFEGDPFDARTPYRMKTAGPTPADSGVIQILPPGDFIGDEVRSQFLDALGKGNALDQPNLIRLIAYWPSESPAFFVEEDTGGTRLEDVLAWNPSLTPSDVLAFMEQFELASAQAADCGLKLSLCGEGQVLLHFLDPGVRFTEETIGKLAGMPVREWPPFRLKVRTFPTFLSLARSANDLMRADHRTEAMQFAWWAQKLLNRRDPESVKSMLADVLTGRAGAMIQSGGELIQSLRSLLENNEETTWEALRRPLEGMHPGTQEHKATSMEVAIETGVQEDAQDPESISEEEEEEDAPGLAEVLFSDTNEPEVSPTEPIAPQPRIGNFLLTVLVVLIALLLAAIFAQLSGEAFWLK